MTLVNRQPAAPMTVRRLAQNAGVSVHVVRNYLRRGLLRPSSHTAAGYQLFSAAEVLRLHFVRTAQELGLTLAEIEEILRRSRQRKSPCPLVRDILVRRLAETRAHLEHLMALQVRMADAAAKWANLPDRIPTGEDICALIDAVAASAPSARTPSNPRRLLARRTTPEFLP